MRNLLILTGIIAIGFLSSCSSDSRKEGCTDPIATNYQSFADYDNGSCFYNADIVFWYDAITANELNLYSDIIYGPIDRLDFYVEDVYVGSETPAQAFIYDGIPICNEPTYVSTTMEWDNNRNTLVNYRVIGVHEALLADLETLVDEYSYDLTANECAPFQVRFLTKKKK